MKQTILTEFILTDKIDPLVTEQKNKDKELTRLLLQNPNGLDLGQNRLTLSEIVDSRIKYDIDMICLPETYIN